MVQFDWSEDGVLNILRACGIRHKSIKKLSDLSGLWFEFRYKHGIICQQITTVTLIMSKDGNGNKHPQIEISINMPQSPNFVCLACMVKNELFMSENPKWRLISNLGRHNKEYETDEFKLIYSVSEMRKVSRLRKKEERNNKFRIE